MLVDSICKAVQQYTCVHLFVEINLCQYLLLSQQNVHVFVLTCPLPSPVLNETRLDWTPVWMQCVGFTGCLNYKLTCLMFQATKFRQQLPNRVVWQFQRCTKFRSFIPNTPFDRNCWLIFTDPYILCHIHVYWVDENKNTTDSLIQMEVNFVQAINFTIYKDLFIWYTVQQVTGLQQNLQCLRKGIQDFLSIRSLGQMSCGSTRHKPTDHVHSTT